MDPSPAERAANCGDSAEGAGLGSMGFVALVGCREMEALPAMGSLKGGWGVGKERGTYKVERVL